jgi:hypothetical protein
LPNHFQPLAYQITSGNLNRCPLSVLVTLTLITVGTKRVGRADPGLRIQGSRATLLSFLFLYNESYDAYTNGRKIRSVWGVVLKYWLWGCCVDGSAE